MICLNNYNRFRRKKCLNNFNLILIKLNYFCFQNMFYVRYRKLFFWFNWFFNWQFLCAVNALNQKKRRKMILLQCTIILKVVQVEKDN